MGFAREAGQPNRTELGPDRGFCVSIDVERDYRTDDRIGTRGIEEGLPAFIDLLDEHNVPFDLMVSGEVTDAIPKEVTSRGTDLSLGCHAQSHVPGYLNRLSLAGQVQSIREATEAIVSAFHQRPTHFRAPNFSANADTIRTILEAGYKVDSSLLPERVVRRWRVVKRIDHRNVPRDPFFVDPSNFPFPGKPGILEIPVTPNPSSPGSPLGLGFLNFAGSKRFLSTLAQAPERYVVFLAHTWEMVTWGSADRVLPWVRSASSADFSPVEDLLSHLGDRMPTTLTGILTAHGETTIRRGERISVADHYRGPANDS